MKGLKWLAAAIGISSASSSGAAELPAQATPEHAVIVHFSYGSTDLSRLFKLEEKLEAEIANAKAGELDGNEVAVDGSDGYLYMYGPDGDRLFKVIEPLLKETPFMKGAKVKIRYGRPTDGVREREISIAS